MTVWKTRMSRGLMYFFFQAEDGIRDLVRSRGLGDVYKKQNVYKEYGRVYVDLGDYEYDEVCEEVKKVFGVVGVCLLYTSDAADDLLCVDLGGRRIIKKKIEHI